MHFLIFLDSRAVQPPSRKETSEYRPRPLSLETQFSGPVGRVMILHALRKLVLFCPDDCDVANCEPGRGFVKEGVLSPRTPEWRQARQSEDGRKHHRWCMRELECQTLVTVLSPCRCDRQFTKRPLLPTKDGTRIGTEVYTLGNSDR